MMKILIIGGTRFFGYHLTRRFLDEGHEVTLFNRGQTSDDLGDKVYRIQGDRYDRNNFRSQLSGKTFDVVVDMIAFKARDSQDAVDLFKGRVGHFIHISTGAVYVVTRDFLSPLKEEDFSRPLYPRPKKDDGLWSYGYNKRQCEKVLEKAHNQHQFPVTMFRPPVVVGERDHTLRAYSYFIRLQDGHPLIVPDGGLNVSSYVYQGDIVNAIASNLHNSRALGQAYNLAMEEIISLREFIKEAARIIGKEVPLVDIPLDFLRNIPWGNSISPFSRRRPFILDVSKAKKDLDYSSTSFELWMKQTIRWFRKDYRGGPPSNYKFRKEETQLINKYQKAIQSITGD